MAKLIVAGMLIFAMLVAANAGFAPSRGLLQESGLFNCEGVKKLGESASSNKCCQLCWCLGNQSPNKIFAGQSLQTYCQQQCSQCVAAAYDVAQCPSASSPLPQICKQGLQFNAMISNLVDKCANMYFNDNTSLDRALGC